jgi:signal recognition particle GTPase
MLDNLTARLGRVMKQLRGEARLTDANIQDALREVRMALLEADVALPVVRDFISAVRDKAVGQEVVSSLTPGQALVGIVQRELATLMGGSATPLISPQRRRRSSCWRDCRVRARPRPRASWRDCSAPTCARKCCW